jgi:hypothetical protein
LIFYDLTAAIYRETGKLGSITAPVSVEHGTCRFADGKTVDFAVLSTNIYQKIDGRWLMISHQAGQIPK